MKPAGTAAAAAAAAAHAGPVQQWTAAAALQMSTPAVVQLPADCLAMLPAGQGLPPAVV